MPEMTKENMIEKMQDAELVAWNDWKTAEQIQGEGSTLAHAMKNRHAAIRDLMEEMGIMKKDRIERK